MRGNSDGGRPVRDPHAGKYGELTPLRQRGVGGPDAGLPPTLSRIEAQASTWTPRLTRLRWPIHRLVDQCRGLRGERDSSPLPAKRSRDQLEAVRAHEHDDHHGFAASYGQSYVPPWDASPCSRPATHQLADAAGAHEAIVHGVDVNGPALFGRGALLTTGTRGSHHQTSRCGCRLFAA